jgi:membrane fusion protein, multidrug efflux system
MSGKLSPSKRTRFYIILLVAVAIFFGGLYGLKWYQNKQAADLAASQPPVYQTISSELSKSAPWHSHANSVATVVAVQGVDITTQVSGKVLEILFKAGDIVKKDQEIVRLEDFAEVQQLNNYLATLKINKLTMDRQYKVYKSGLIAEEDYDMAKAAYQEALANVKQEQANIDYKHIRAPFAGQLGIDDLNVGQYLSAGDPISDLETLQPIYANFDLPEQYYNITKKDQWVSLTLSSMPGKLFVGKVHAKSASVDATTRNFTVQAIFLNKENLLKPGMFANSDIRLGKKEQVVIVPRTSVVYSLYGNYIYTLEAAGSDKDGKLYKIKQIPADLGEVVGPNVIVKSGLKVGQQVVVSGQLKVFNGNTVRVNNTVKLPPMKDSELMRS